MAADECRCPVCAALKELEVDRAEWDDDDGGPVIVRHTGQYPAGSVPPPVVVRDRVLNDRRN